MQRIYFMSASGRRTLDTFGHMYHDTSVLTPSTQRQIRQAYRLLRDAGVDKYKARYVIVDLLAAMPMRCVRHPDGSITEQIVSVWPAITQPQENWT